MARFARILLLTTVAVTMVGMFTVTAFAGEGCSTAKKASAKENCAATCAASAKLASAEGASCASKTQLTSAESGSCAGKAQLTSAECQSLCAKSMASLASMEPFKFMKDVNAKHVNVQVESTKNGFAFVFAGVNDKAIPEAKKAGMMAFESINKPANCGVTRSAMAEKSGGCEYTQACLSALADAEIEMVETEAGAKAVIFSKNAAKVKELHAFMQQLTASAEPTSKS